MKEIIFSCHIQLTTMSFTGASPHRRLHRLPYLYTNNNTKFKNVSEHIIVGCQSQDTVTFNLKKDHILMLCDFKCRWTWIKIYSSILSPQGLDETHLKLRNTTSRHRTSLSMPNTTLSIKTSSVDTKTKPHFKIDNSSKIYQKCNWQNPKEDYDNQ